MLFRTGGDQWMLHRMDPPDDPDREPFPDHVEPMSATSGDLPPDGDDDAYGFEIAWDGVRVLAYVDGGRVRLQGDGLDDLGPRYRSCGPWDRRWARPRPSSTARSSSPAPGRPDQDRLEARRAADSDASARRAADRDPVAYMVYDLLFLDGHATVDLPYAERRRRLDGLGVAGGGPAWQVPAFHVGDGEALLALARQQGLAGVVAKRLTSPYRPGTRSPDWIEVRA